MTALTYVGTLSGSTRTTTLRRFANLLTARFASVPFRAWTQSYGPFRSLLVRLLARYDLSRQPIVFCRGDDCLREVRNLLPNAIAESFPDVACVLPYDQQKGAADIRELFGDMPDRLVTISPSSIIEAQTDQRDGIMRHSDMLKEVIAYLLEHGFSVLLVPHSYYGPNRGPKDCDDALSRMVFQSLAPHPRLRIVEDDLSPITLKGFIANARFHLGGRYHSVVAALSSGVPTISMSWHPKYRDLMREYGMEDFAVEVLGMGSAEPALEHIRRLDSAHDTFRRMILDRHKSVRAAIETNAAHFVQVLPA